MITYIVDSFTDHPFSGNPAGVCINSSPIDDRLMLQIAQELGLSETAFVHPIDDSGQFGIRYFSPKMEIPLCGHATLAAAHVLMTSQGHGSIEFITAQDLRLVASEEDNQITMQFPAYTTSPAEVSPRLLSALGLDEIENAAYNAETRILLLEITDSQLLADLQPDFDALYRSRSDINGVLVTAVSSSDDYDFHSRYFWPWSGTNEDPVTGGTHTFLTGYWSTRLGKTRLRSYQSSKRGGFMQVELRDHSVLITSQAVIVFEGELSI